MILIFILLITCVPAKGSQTTSVFRGCKLGKPAEYYINVPHYLCSHAILTKLEKQVNLHSEIAKLRLDHPPWHVLAMLNVDSLSDSSDLMGRLSPGESRSSLDGVVLNLRTDNTTVIEMVTMETCNPVKSRLKSCFLYADIDDGWQQMLHSNPGMKRLITGVIMKSQFARFPAGKRVETPETTRYSRRNRNPSLQRKLEFWVTSGFLPHQLIGEFRLDTCLFYKVSNQTFMEKVNKILTIRNVFKIPLIQTRNHSKPINAKYKSCSLFHDEMCQDQSIGKISKPKVFRKVIDERKGYGYEFNEEEILMRALPEVIQLQSQFMGRKKMAGYVLTYLESGSYFHGDLDKQYRFALAARNGFIP